jgi:tungstate transport system substrate-binding protein
VNKTIRTLFFLLMVLALVVTGCATPATQAPATEAPAAPTEALAPTEPPAPTEEPAPTQRTREEGKLILATTTSTQDSGLLDVLLPDFEQEAGVDVDVIAVGTGQALQLGEDGNADVLLVHARAREDEFMAGGHGTRREDVMYNDFVVLGPASDPAGIKGMTSAAEAFAKIAETESPFISRGDESGTHTKELSVWKAAGIEEPSGDWYNSTGQGMGEVLTIANEQQAYTLSDRATYLARTKEGLDLEVVVEGDKALFNPYGVITVNPEKNDAIQAELAEQFLEWIISVSVQEKIGQFGVEDFGQSLFIPDSQPWRDHMASMQPTTAPAGEAALKVTGLVENEMAWTEDEVKAMPTVTVQAQNNQGQTEDYTGVLIKDLLALAVAKPEATTVVFVADDGYTAEVPLAEMLACETCIISFRSQGGFSTVLPDYPKNVQVKGVIEIQVQ